MDTAKFHGTSRRAASARDLIRAVTAHDIDFLLDLTVCIYGNVNVPFIRSFIENNVENPNICMLMTDRAFGVAFVSDYPFLYNTREAVMEFLAAEKSASWDAYFILKKMIEWADIMGAGEFYMRSKTKVSLEPFAKRLGFSLEPQGFALKINRRLH